MKSKKKNKDKDRDLVEEDYAEESVAVEVVEKHKKKKKKKLKEKDVTDVTEEESPVYKTKKRKHNSSEQDVDDEKPKKHKKKKRKHQIAEEPIEENIVSNGDKANCENSDDSIHEKKRPKKSKKNKRDKEETETHEQRGAPSVDVGQWGTADLGDTQRQNKFFKLLGGFNKAGGDGDTRPTASVKPFATKFNSALGKKNEASLNSSLERQFENARHTQLHAKGLGLGFSQPKTNSIDMYSSKSKKFDD